MGLDVVGAAAFLLISMAFGIVRGQPARFLAVCAAVIAGGAVLTRDARPAGPDWGILFAGLALYSFGLLFLRTMLRRSVSLRLLAACADERSPAAVREDIGRRLGELSRYGLARRVGPEYRLTPWGRSLAAVLGVVYNVLRLKA